CEASIANLYDFQTRHIANADGIQTLGIANAYSVQTLGIAKRLFHVKQKSPAVPGLRGLFHVEQSPPLPRVP
ncbi:MAG TPA: hypothetical protein VF774_20680, partial [Pseudoduganella sp.]